MRRKTTKYYETMFMAWLETEMDIENPTQQTSTTTNPQKWKNHQNAVLLLQASIWAPASDEELGFRLQAVVNFYLYILCEILLKMLGAYGNKHKLN